MRVLQYAPRHITKECIDQCFCVGTHDDTHTFAAFAQAWQMHIIAEPAGSA
jgi:hypothetical protein